MNLQNKRFQSALDRINQNISAARIVSDISQVEFHFDKKYNEFKYNFSNKSNGVYFEVGVLFDPYPERKTDESYTSYETIGIHRIGAVPEIFLRKGHYQGNIWVGIETGDEKDKYKQFLNLIFDGNKVIPGEIGKTRSKVAPIVTELSDLIQKGWKNKSNHADVLRAIDLSFRLLTFPDRDAIDLIGEIG